MRNENAPNLPETSGGITSFHTNKDGMALASKLTISSIFQTTDCHKNQNGTRIVTVYGFFESQVNFRVCLRSDWYFTFPVLKKPGLEWLSAVLAKGVEELREPLSERLKKETGTPFVFAASKIAAQMFSPDVQLVLLD